MVLAEDVMFLQTVVVDTSVTLNVSLLYQQSVCSHEASKVFLCLFF